VTESPIDPGHELHTRVSQFSTLRETNYSIRAASPNHGDAVKERSHEDINDGWRARVAAVDVRLRTGDRSGLGMQQ